MERVALAFHNMAFLVPVGALLQMTLLTVVSPRQCHRHCPQLSAEIAAKFGLPKLRQLTVTTAVVTLTRAAVYECGASLIKTPWRNAWQQVVASVSKSSCTVRTEA